MSLKEDLKTAIIEGLNLDLTPADIGDDAPLFGEGLGLDSLDAVELVIIVQKHFGVAIQDMTEGKDAFQSITTLAQYIEAHKSA